MPTEVGQFVESIWWIFEDLFFGLRGLGTYLIVHECKTPSL